MACADSTCSWFQTGQVGYLVLPEDILIIDPIHTLILDCDIVQAYASTAVAVDKAVPIHLRGTGRGSLHSAVSATRCRACTQKIAVMRQAHAGKQGAATTM